jgi:hypothetical protein
MKRRREVITLLSGAAAWPLVARAQQGERMRRIGVLQSLAADDPEGQARLAAFAQGLRQSGWTIGRNVQIDTRWAAGDAERFRRYGAELAAATSYCYCWIFYENPVTSPAATHPTCACTRPRHRPQSRKTRLQPGLQRQATGCCGLGDGCGRPGDNRCGYLASRRRRCSVTLHHAARRTQSVARSERR